MGNGGSGGKVGDKSADGTNFSTSRYELKIVDGAFDAQLKSRFSDHLIERIFRIEEVIQEIQVGEKWGKSGGRESGGKVGGPKSIFVSS